MSDLFRSAGLAPVAGTIDWLTRARREERFSAGLAPVESTIRPARGDEQSSMRSTGTSPARGEMFRQGRPLACQSLPTGDKLRMWRNKTSTKVTLI
jgi:hypothetical protein